MTIQKTKSDLLLACDVSSEILRKSTDIDDKTSAHMLAYYPRVKQMIESLMPGNRLNSYSLKIAATEVLTFWNQRIGIDTELFWSKMRAGGAEIERKDPLEFALEKKRFRNVEQGMSARQSWKKLRKHKAITERFSATEIATIDRIIEEDESKRLALLKKCLLDNKLPASQYLKFGECWAYFKNCGLLDKYFSEEESSRLYRLWENFK